MPRQKKKTDPQTEPQQMPVAKRSMSTAEAFETLRRRANQGDQEARKALIQFLNSNDWLWERFGNVAAHAENSVVEALTRGEWLTTAAIHRAAGEMRKRLAGPAPTPLEQMAVERVVITWLQLQHVEMRAAQPQRDREWATFWMRKQESADKMYRAALASLALIRELLPAPVAPAVEPGVIDIDAARGTKATANGHCRNEVEPQERVAERGTGDANRSKGAKGRSGSATVPNGQPVNRMAVLLHTNGSREPADDGVLHGVNGRARGHRNRLNGILTPAIGN